MTTGRYSLNSDASRPIHVTVSYKNTWGLRNWYRACGLGCSGAGGWVRYLEPLVEPAIAETPTLFHWHTTTTAIAACGHNTHTQTHTFKGPFFREYPGEPVPKKVKPMWILLKQETVSGSGINWTTCMSAPRSRQTTMPAPHHSVFYRLDALPATQPTASKHWYEGTQGWPQSRRQNDQNFPGFSRAINLIFHRYCNKK